MAEDTPTPASQKVFNIAELLEHILLDLDPLTILTSSRVRRGFRNTVQQSTPIRRLLFFDASPALKANEERPNNSINPWLLDERYFSSEYRELQCVAITYDHCDVDWDTTFSATWVSIGLLRADDSRLKMQIAIPPISEVEIRTSWPAEALCAEQRVLESEGGLTYGDIYRAYFGDRYLSTKPLLEVD